MPLDPAPLLDKRLFSATDLLRDVLASLDSSELAPAAGVERAVPRGVQQVRCGQRIEFGELEVPSPFALPLMVERFREKLSTGKDRLDRMLKDMERAADEAAAGVPAPRRGRRRPIDPASP